MTSLQGTVQELKTWDDYKKEIDDMVKEINEEFRSDYPNQGALEEKYKKVLLLCEKGLQLRGLPVTYEELKTEEAREKIKTLVDQQNSSSAEHRIDGADATYMLIAQLKGLLADPTKDYPETIAFYRAAIPLLPRDNVLVHMKEAIGRILHSTTVQYPLISFKGGLNQKQIKLEKTSIVALLAITHLLTNSFPGKNHLSVYVARQMIKCWNDRAHILLQKIAQDNTSQLSAQDEQLLNGLLYAPILKKEGEAYVKKFGGKKILHDYYSSFIQISYEKINHLQRINRNQIRQTTEQKIAHHRQMIFLLERAQEVYNRLLASFAHFPEENVEREKKIISQISYTTIKSMQKAYESLLENYKMLGLLLYYRQQYRQALPVFQKAEPIIKILQHHPLRVTRAAIRSNQPFYSHYIDADIQDIQDMLKATKERVAAIRLDELNESNRSTQSDDPHQLTESNDFPHLLRRVTNIPAYYWWILVVSGLLGISYIVYKKKWFSKKSKATRVAKDKSIPNSKIDFEFQST